MDRFVDPRLRYVRQEENLGANGNFNYLLDNARGDFFQLLQDDDLIDPDFVAACIAAADGDDSVGIIRTGTRVIDSDGNTLKESPNRVGGLSTGEFFVGWFRGRTAFYLCSTVFNTRYLKEMGGFGSLHNLFQDVVAEVQLAARHGRVDVPGVKASFRKHAGEMTSSAKVDHWCQDSRYLLDLMVNLVGPDQAADVRRHGLLYFSQINYGFARSIASPSKRLGAYLRIFREFECRYPPFYFAFRKHSRRLMRLARRAKRALLAGQ
jgi:glycosyltransferase involved in cell wall biosynthesis